MAAALTLVLSILLLFVATWVAIFGGVGMVLSTSRGGAALTGLAWGVTLGACGWLAIVWRTRTRRRPPAADAGWPR